MDEFHKAMSWEEYLVYPRKLGWKYEYFASALHLSPSWTAVAELFLPLDNLQALGERVAKVQRDNVAIRPAEQSDIPSLVSLFCECFSGAIGYAGCDSADLLRYAHRSLDHFFAPEPPAFLSVLRVAVEEEQIVGCCMIDRGKLGPTLQPIFVAPDHQRRGIANRLLFDAIQTLAAQSENRLRSNCNLGNEASIAWHLQCGFVEILSRWTAGHRANIYLQEAERQELLGLPTAIATRKLADFWAKQRAQLELD